MALVPPSLTGPRSTRDRAWLAVLFGAWLALVCWQVARHDMWRDEVRALSLALQGDSVAAMLHALGDGHPALWHLLLRGAHALAPTPLVLPALALAIGVAAMALLTFASPFRPWLVALVLFSGFGLFEYVVMARNYGISALLLFALAALLSRPRAAPLGIGALLFLLANTNVHSAVLVLALLLALAVEHRHAPRRLAWPAALALAGLLVCARQVYPTLNDAVTIDHPSLAGAATALLDPALGFSELAPFWPGAHVMLALAMVLSPLALWRWPAAFVGAVTALAGLSLLFGMGYPGSYRHEALYPVFLLTLAWIAARGGFTARAAPPSGVQRTGDAALALLIALQVAVAATLVAGELRLPRSRVRDLATLLARDRLAGAIVIGNPEVSVEALPYYAANPIWLAHEHRFGRTATFTRHADQHLTLAGLLATGERLHRATGRPVVLAIDPPLDPAAPPQLREDSYVWSLHTTPAEVRTFLARTQTLARFGPSLSGETFAVYLLR